MIDWLDANLAEALAVRIMNSPHAWLVLDYDGTLAEFAPNPDTILPDSELIALITRLAKHSNKMRVVILSGRMFRHIQELLPVPGVLLAGTYGIEYQTWDGEMHTLIDYQSERPYLEKIKAAWAAMIENRPEFYLEDKGYALALHGGKASDQEAADILERANQAASGGLGGGVLRIAAGKKFLEVAPNIADKGQSLNVILERFFWPDALIVYLGDDDKDEQAFAVVREHTGVPIVVSAEPRPSLAAYRLNNPAEVRSWLSILADHLDSIEERQDLNQA